MTNILSMFANYHSNRLCKVWTRRVLRGRITSSKRRLLSARGAIPLTLEIKMKKKKKIHSSWNIEYFVETHFRKLCVILRSRVIRVLCPY